MPFTFEEAIEAIDNKQEFKIRVADGVTIIDYMITAKDTFVGRTPRETFILQNLRGTAFNSDGRIVSLPFHKFHNKFKRFHCFIDVLNDSSCANGFQCVHCALHCVDCFKLFDFWCVLFACN